MNECGEPTSFDQSCTTSNTIVIVMQLLVVVCHGEMESLLAKFSSSVDAASLRFVQKLGQSHHNNSYIV